MSKPNEERDIYYIPPNFLTSGRLFGGMIRARNAIEACVLVLLSGFPIIKLPFSLTIRIILLCLISLPLGIFAVVGFEGDSLSEFLVNWLRWIVHRRTLYRSDVQAPEPESKPPRANPAAAQHTPPEQLGIRIKQKPQKRKRRKKPRQPAKRTSKQTSRHSKKKQPPKAEDFIPVKDIRNGIIETTDGRYIRVIEVEPINFLLRSISEQKNIVANFASWMKISPVKIQIKVLTKKADIEKHLRTIERDMEAEENPKCRELQLDYYHLIQTIGSREAITRRFLVIFEYEAVTNRKPEYSEIVSELETAVQTARQYFLHCDNAVVAHEDENAFLMEIIYTVFNRATCEVKPVERRVTARDEYNTSSDSIAQLMAGIAVSENCKSVYDGACGYGLGLMHAHILAPNATVEGQDININCVMVCAIMQWLAFNSTFTIELGDTLRSPLSAKRKQKYDAVIMAPPFGLRIDDDVILSATEETVKYGDLLQRKSDWFFVQHAMAVLSGKGTGVLHLPMGALFQGGKVQEIREVFVRNRHIHAVISLPEGAVPGTAILSTLIVVKEDTNDSGVLFVNGAAPQISNYFFRAKRGVTTISAEGISELTSIVRERKEIEGVSSIATLEEIAGKKYLLTPSAYTDASNEEKTHTEPVEDICTAISDLEQDLILNARELAEAVLNFNSIINR